MMQLPTIALFLVSSSFAGANKQWGGSQWKTDANPVRGCFCNFPPIIRDDCPGNELDNCSCRFNAGSCECKKRNTGLYLNTYYDCGTDDCCTTTTRRKLELHDPEYASFKETCDKMLFHVSLHVDDHVRAIVAPSEEAYALGCPMFVAHSIYDGDNEEMKKELLVWEDKHEGESNFKQEETFFIGTFTLSELSDAFENTKANSDTGTAYNLLTNNCGTFMINLASALDVNIDKGVASFVARRLLKSSGKQLITDIKNLLTSSFGSDDRHLRHQDEKDTLNDQDLVRWLVDSQAHPVVQ